MTPSTGRWTPAPCSDVPTFTIAAGSVPFGWTADTMHNALHDQLAALGVECRFGELPGLSEADEETAAKVADLLERIIAGRALDIVVIHGRITEKRMAVLDGRPS